MSKYRIHKFECRSLDALKEAIADRIAKYFLDTKGLGKEEALEKGREIVESQVQIDLENPQHLEGYEFDTTGQVRDEKHQIIIPRKTINEYLSGGSSNDAGFTFTDEGCDADISDYDKGKWWNKSQDRFWQVAATKEACDLAWANPDVVGVEVEEIDGNIEIYCTLND